MAKKNDNLIVTRFASPEQTAGFFRTGLLAAPSLALHKIGDEDEEIQKKYGNVDKKDIPFIRSFEPYELREMQDKIHRGAKSYLVSGSKSLSPADYKELTQTFGNFPPDRAADIIKMGKTGNSRDEKLYDRLFKTALSQEMQKSGFYKDRKEEEYYIDFYLKRLAKALEEKIK